MLPRIKQWVRSNRRSIFVALWLILLYLGMFAVGITCPIKYLTGISCPGCGLSRAWFHALTLDFEGAFACHPLFWLVPAALVFAALQKKRRFARIALYAIILLALTVYGLRMADPADAVVVFAPQEGLFYRILQAVWRSLR